MNNSYCQIERVNATTGRCRDCGRTGTLTGDVEPARVFWPKCRKKARRPGPAGPAVKRPPAIPPCAHRGEQVSTIGCEACGGNGKFVQIKVFACAVHEECTLGRTKEKIVNCLECTDRVERIALPVVPRARPDGPIRVGLISPVFGTGGVERWWIALARHFPAGVVASGIALTDGAPTDQGTIDEITRYAPAFGSRRLGTIGRDARNGIQRFDSGQQAIDTLAAQSDLLIAWSTPDQTARLRPLGKPIVLVSHGSGPWTRKLMSDSVAHATHFAAVCEAAANVYPAAVRERVKVIHNGVEIDRLVPTASRAEIRARLGIPIDAPTLAFVGRFSPEKDPLAAAKVAGRVSGMHALYCGVGFEAGEVQTEIRAILGDRAHFMFDGSVGNALAAVDVQLLSSREEGAPLVALEAWHAGIPLAATSVGMLPDLRREFGQLYAACQIDDVESQTQAVLIAMHPAFHPVVEKARRIAWEHFTAPRMAMRWAEYLTAVMSEWSLQKP